MGFYLNKVKTSLVVMVTRKLCIGDRISVDNEIATIKFVGSVPPTKGEWLGVEWDNPERGRHNGSKDGIQYFTCQNESGGSFLREHKVNRGVTLLQAVETCYREPAQLESHQIQNKTVQMIGMDSLVELHKLKTVSLIKSNVSSLGNPGELGNLLPGLVEIDLYGNLISSWEDVNMVLKELSTLKQINLSNNKLRWKNENIQEDIKPSLNIETVVLNNCGLNWQQIMQSSQMWPNVKMICLSFNNITDIEIPSSSASCFEHVRHIEMNGNPLNSWQTVKNLNSLSVEKLQVDNCGFSSLQIDVDDLKSLKSLSLNQNNFENASIFNELNKLALLEELHFMKNPLNEKDSFKEFCLEIIIAKIAGLRKVNNMKVDAELRFDGELDYLRRFGADWRNSVGHQDLEQNKPNEAFIFNHPRYMDLCKAHGAPQDNEVFKQTTALKSSLIEVTIVDTFDPSFKPITKKLPSSMKVSTLKMVVQRLTKTKTMKGKRIVYVSKNDETFVVELSRESETLHDVSIQEGDCIQLRASLLDSSDVVSKDGGEQVNKSYKRKRNLFAKKRK